MMENKPFFERIDLVFQGVDTMGLTIAGSIDRNEFEKFKSDDSILSNY